MSEVRVCDVCHSKAYADQSGAACQRTIEYETDDGEVLAADHELCGACKDRLLYGTAPVCPFCLEPVLQDEDPRDCPQRPEVDA